MATGTKASRPKARKRREAFGSVEKRDSGRYRVRYTGPDGLWHNAPSTFDNLTDARNWLAVQKASITTGTWGDQQAQAAAREEARQTLGDYAAGWIAERTSPTGAPLRDRTREEYERLLRTALAPLADVPLDRLTPARVRSWYRETTERGTLTTAARAYGLLRSICRTAVDDKILAANPASIRGAQNASTGRRVAPPAAAELAVIVEHMPERYRAAVLVAAWAGLRFGELTELRRHDLTRIDLGGRDVWVVRVERAVVRTARGPMVGKPKSEAGVRSVTLPPHVTEAVDEHLRQHVEPQADALLFPARSGGHLPESSLAKVWYPARKAAGREDLPWHGLRHFGATRAALAGATLKELQERLGHSTVIAAMRYQHTAGRDAELAARMSAMAEADR